MKATAVYYCIWMDRAFWKEVHVQTVKYYSNTCEACQVYQRVMHQTHIIAQKLMQINIFFPYILFKSSMLMYM